MHATQVVFLSLLGFCQGYLGFPTIQFAPIAGRAIASIWSIPQDKKILSTKFTIVVVLIFFGLAHLAIPFAYADFFTKVNNHHDRNLWVICFMIGVLSFTIIPGIEWRIRRRRKKH